MSQSGAMTDTRVVRAVVWLVGLIGLSSIGLAGLLAMTSHDVPSQLWTVSFGCVTGLVALLSSTRSVDVDGLQQLADAQAPPAEPDSSPPPAPPSTVDLSGAWSTSYPGSSTVRLAAPPGSFVAPVDVALTGSTADDVIGALAEDDAPNDDRPNDDAPSVASSFYRSSS